MLIVIGLFSFFFTVSTEQDVIMGDNFEGAENTMDKIDRMLEERYSDIRVMAGEKSFERHLRSLVEGTSLDEGSKQDSEDRIKDLATLTGPWNSLLIVDTRGSIVFSTRQKEIGKSLSGMYYQNLSYLKAMKGEINHSDFVILKHTGQPAVVFAAPIRDEGDPLQPIIGAVIGDLSWAAVSQILKKIKDDNILLLNGSGDIIASNIKDGKSVLLDGSQSRSIIRELKKLNVSSTIIHQSQGIFHEDTLVSVAFQEGHLSYKGNGWFLVSTDPSQIAFASANKAATQMVLIVLPLILLMSGGILWIIRRFIVVPITALTETVRHVSSGDLTERSLISSNNEIGQLAVAFNQMTAKLKDTQEKLEQRAAQREAMYEIQKEFTSTVSHELRTPLAAIKSSVDILDTEIPGKLTEDQKTFIKRVKSNIDRLARLINDVLDLSKLESGKMAMNFLPLRPESVVREVVESQASVVESKGLKIETEFDGKLPTLIADKDRLIQVLNNLINNALKFTKEGKITVSAHCEDKQYITFCVRDTGIGIKEEDLPKLFQKFQQVGGASQHVGGTGLGLAICKEIITRHNGRMWVESKSGEGSAFYFTIAVRKEKRILIVDDDQATLEVLSKILEAEGNYEIERASDGFLAGQKIYDFVPHLVILDVKIPKMNGMEVCSRIKSDPKTKNTKIIMLSGFDTQRQIKEAWDVGADEILNKPVNMQELIAKVKKLI